MFALVQLWSAAALAQDPVNVDPGHYKLVLENASVRVLKVDYPAGGKSPMHQHPDTIVIPLLAAKVRFTTRGEDDLGARRRAVHRAWGASPGEKHRGKPVNYVIVAIK